MPPTSKSRIAMQAANYPVPDEDGKIPFNAKVGADFQRLKNMMAVTGFFAKYNGPMAFFDAPEHHNWSSTYTRASWPNGWNAAKKKSADAVLGAQVPGAAAATVAAAAASAEEDQDDDDLFALTTSFNKKRAVSPFGPGEPTKIVEGVVDLKTDRVLPLAKHEKFHVSTHFAEVVKGHNKTYICQLTLVPESGAVPFEIVPDPDGEDYVMEANFSRLKYTVEDAPNGDSVFVLKQRISQVTTRTDWKKKTIQASTTGVDLENWSRGTVALENHIAQYQEKDNDPIYSVSQFTLPFKCIKKIEEKDIFPVFDATNGSAGLTFHLWHSDQSGRQNVSIKKPRAIIKF